MAVKTNALLILESAAINFEAFEYETADGQIDAVSVARKIGRTPEETFKTLVTEDPKHEHFVFVIPANCELDLKKAAKSANDKNVEMIHVKELLPLTGYIRGGGSPVGMKKAYPVFIEESAVLYDSIGISAGERGVQMMVAPENLVSFLGAELADITVY